MKKIIWLIVVSFIEIGIGRAQNVTQKNPTETERRVAADKIEMRKRIYATLSNLRREGKAQEALIKIDQMISSNPAVLSLYKEKFEIMLSIDEDKAYWYATEISQDVYRGSDVYLLQLADDILQAAVDKKIRKPNWTLAICLSEMAFANAKYHPVKAIILDFQCRVYAYVGQMKRAVETEKRVIALFDAAKRKTDEIDKSIYVEQLKRYESLLAKNSETVNVKYQ